MDHRRAIQQTSPDRQIPAPLFGMQLSALDAEACAALMSTRRDADTGVGLFVTPNIQHVAGMRTDPEFAAAMAGAEIIVCDGFPVYRYARLRGHVVPGRVTGREVIERMIAHSNRLAGHRLFFVLDSQVTAHAVSAWASADVPSAEIEIVVPPFGFDADPIACAALATRIAGFGTTILFMGIGAPRSELFVHRQRARLPCCWALCVGQSFKVALGMTTPPPALMVRLNLEWAWRILLEPRRMLARYGPSGIGFLQAIAGDLRNGPVLSRQETRS